MKTKICSTFIYLLFGRMWVWVNVCVCLCVWTLICPILVSCFVTLMSLGVYYDTKERTTGIIYDLKRIFWRLKRLVLSPKGYLESYCNTPDGSDGCLDRSGSDGNGKKWLTHGFFLKYSWKKCLMNWINIVTEKEEPNMTLSSLLSNQKTMTIAVEMDKVSVGADLQKN